MKSGYLLINKPKDITSFGCINHIKNIINQKIKIGHAGTLDPFATGLLIIGIGRSATKSMDDMISLDKKYLVQARIGELTDTFDKTGNILKRDSKYFTENFPNKEKILEAINKIGKSYTQYPPIYSALKHKGQPLYKLAREKKLSQQELEKIIETKKRKVEIFSLDLIDYSPPFFTFITHVSKGTYIRSLANDIAKKLDSYATTYELTRTAIGNITLDKAIDLEEIKTYNDILNNITQVTTS